MSPPRRPRGESPRTTIRFLQRQIANLQQGMLAERNDNHELRKQIARQDVELSEATDAERMLASEAKIYSEKYGALLGAYQNQALRLQFLEGYYHAKRETFPGSGAGHQGAHQVSAAAGEESRPETAPGWHGSAIGSEARRFQTHDRAPDNRRPLEGEKDQDRARS